MKALDWIFGARPLLHLPVWSVFLVALHYHNELSGDRFGYQDFLILICLTLLGAGACYLNLVYDAESDRLNNKGHFLQRGILSERALMAGFIITSVSGLALSATISSLILFICLQLFVLSYVYSAPPARLKDRPIGGLLSNGWGIGFLSAVAVFPHMQVDNSGLLGWDIPFYFFAAVGSIYIVTTIPDQYGDAVAGKETIAIVVGRKGSLLLAILLMLIAALAAWESDYPVLMWLAVVGAVGMLVALVTHSDHTVRLAAKLPLVLLTLLAGWFYSVYFIFVVVLIVATRIYYARRLGIRYPQVA